MIVLSRSSSPVRRLGVGAHSLPPVVLFVAVLAAALEFVLAALGIGGS